MENTTTNEQKTATTDHNSLVTPQSNLVAASKRSAALISEDSVEFDDDNEEDEENPRHCFQCFSTTSKRWFSGSFGGDEAFVCESCYNKQNPAPAATTTKKSPSKEKAEINDNSNSSKRQRHRTQEWEKNLLELFYRYNVEKNRDNKSYRYPKTTEFKELVEQLKWDAGRVRVWIENRKNKDKDKPRDPIMPSISKGASESTESLNKPPVLSPLPTNVVLPSPVTPTVTAQVPEPIVTPLPPPPHTPVVAAPTVTMPVSVPAPPSPPVPIVKIDGNESVIRALTMRIEQLEKTIGKIQQQNPSPEHHALLLRKISELEMKIESQNKVYQHLAMLDNHNRVLSTKIMELEKAVTYTIMAQHNSMNFPSNSGQQFAHNNPTMVDHHLRAPTTPTPPNPNLTPNPNPVPTQPQETPDQKKKIMLFGKVVDPQ